MSERSKRLLYWTPRILSLAFAAFTSIFALDVFELPVGPWEKLGAFAIHLIPTAFVLLALTVVWRREWIGAFVFPALALLHLVSKWGQLDPIAYIMIEGPLVVLGILFWLNWRDRAGLRPARG